MKYLGRRFSFNKTNEVEVDNRINAGWAKFHMFKNVMCNRRYSLQHRLKLFDAVITPTVLYSMETVSLTEARKGNRM